MKQHMFRVIYLIMVQLNNIVNNSFIYIHEKYGFKFHLLKNCKKQFQSNISFNILLLYHMYNDCLIALLNSSPTGRLPDTTRLL